MKAGKGVAKRPSTTLTIGGPGGSLRTESNAIPFVAPIAFALVMWVLALLERLLFRQDQYSWYWSLFVAAVYGGATWFAWRTTRSHPARLHALITIAVGFVGGWTWYLIGVEHQTWRPHAVYWMVALGVSACGVLWLANKGTGDGSHSVLDDLGGAVAKLRAVNEVATNYDTGEVTAAVRMQPGTPAAELTKSGPVIASLLSRPGAEVRPTAVRVLPDRNDASAARLTVSPVDRLATPPRWRAPSIPEGGTADQPVRIGIRATGGAAEFWLSAAPDKMRGAPLVAIVGMSGSGKTGLIKILGLEVLSRLDVAYWLADPRKGGQLPGWLRDGAERQAYGRKDVAAMLRDFLAGVSERADLLGAHGCEVWSSACCYARHGIKLRVLIGDEMAAVASELPELLTNIGESARSTGSVPIFMFQRGTGDRFPTSARAQFNTHICLGVQSEDDAVHGALPEDVLDAGAQPWLWGADAPGMHILAAPGVSAELRAVDCRTYDTRDAGDLMDRWARHYIALRKGDHGSPPVGREVVSAGHAVAPTAPRHGDDAPLDDDSGDFGDVMDDVRDELEGDLGAADDAELAAIAAELPTHPEDDAELAALTGNEEIPDIPPPPGDDVIAIPPKVSSTEARSALYAYIVALRDRAGLTAVRPVDVIEWVTETLGMGKSWLYATMADLTADSVAGPALLRQGEGRGSYEIVTHGPPELEGGDAT